MSVGSTIVLAILVSGPIGAIVLSRIWVARGASRRVRILGMDPVELRNWLGLAWVLAFLTAVVLMIALDAM